MFQTGYLTIVDYNADNNAYKLGYPNREVEVALQKYLLEAFARVDAISAERISLQLWNAFNDKNIERVVELLTQLFAHVPYHLHIKQESFYHGLLQAICTTAGIKAQSEYSTSHGRIDLFLDLPKKRY